MMLKHPLFFPFGQPQLFFPFGRRVAVVTAQSLTNVQKLSLPANTAVGTQVAVTDGFVVSEYFFYPDGRTNGGKPVYSSITPIAENGGILESIFYSTDHWTSGLTDLSDNDYFAVAAAGNETNPWQADWSPSVVTLTHPAIQQLTAPATTQGGVFVAGGTQDGVYTGRGTQNGKTYFNLLGQPASGPEDDALAAVGWDSPNNRFVIYDGGGSTTYYSLSDVATPDLATNWKKASDDSPASITVTSVTQGELDAGLTVAGSGTPEINKVHLKSQANSNGRPSYNQIDLAFDDLTFEPSGGNWQWAATYSSTNTAFPWQAVYSLNGSPAPVPTVTRNNVASEANWTNI